MEGDTNSIFGRIILKTNEWTTKNTTAQSNFFERKFSFGCVIGSAMRWIHCLRVYFKQTHKTFRLSYFSKFFMHENSDMSIEQSSCRISVDCLQHFIFIFFFFTRRQIDDFYLIVWFIKLSDSVWFNTNILCHKSYNTWKTVSRHWMLLHIERQK